MRYSHRKIEAMLPDRRQWMWSHSSPCRAKKVSLVAYAALVSLVLSLSLSSNVCAQSPGDDPLLEDEYLLEYVGRPSSIPLLDNFNETSPNNPGGSGEIRFTVTNRYWEDRNGNDVLDLGEDLNGNDVTDGVTIYQVELHVQIFRYKTLRVTEDIDDDFFHPPTFNGETIAVVQLGNMDWNQSASISLDIDVQDDTPQGTYLVRTRLQYRFGNSTGAQVVLLSRGYFSDQNWEEFEKSKDYNLSLLDTQPVHGIIPETSFHVTKDSPYYTVCLVGLIVISMVLLISAWVFHRMDEHGRYPSLNAKLHNIWVRTPFHRKKDALDEWEKLKKIKDDEK